MIINNNPRIIKLKSVFKKRIIIHNVIIASPKFKMPKCSFFAPFIIVRILTASITTLIKIHTELKNCPRPNRIKNTKNRGANIGSSRIDLVFSSLSNKKLQEQLNLMPPKKKHRLSSFQVHFCFGLLPTKTIQNYSQKEVSKFQELL